MAYTEIFSWAPNMDTFKPTFKTRVHEWLAERVSWIQYPERTEYRRDDPVPPLPKWVWLFTIVPVPLLMAFPLILLIYLVVMCVLYYRTVSR